MRMLNVLLIAFVFVAVYKNAVEAHAQLTLHLYQEFIILFKVIKKKILHNIFAIFITEILC